MRSLLPLCLCLLLSLPATEALAWGPKGHRIIAELGERHLTAAAQASVRELLEGESLATVSTWADEMRSATDNPEFWSRYAAPWHYVNIPAGMDYAASPKNPLGDAYTAVQAFSAILLDEPVPEGGVKEGLEFYFGDLDARKTEVRRFALRFLVHLLGDMQQPLHTGYASDLGGNQVELRWFGERANLHSLWDTLLVEHQNLSYSEYVQRLDNRIGRTPASDIRTLERADPALWMEEARRLLPRLYAPLETGTDLGYDYAAAFVPTVELQLVKGGLRTAYFLNSLFGGWPLGAGL